MEQPPALADWPPGPRRPEAPAAAVDLWLADAGASGWTSEETLRALLGRYLGEEPGAIEIARDQGGKPRLARRPERLRFNLSHSGELVLIAVSALEVGVDVERVAPRRHDLAIAERRLPAAAVEAVREAGDGERAAVFTAHWARFEARNKCLGLGVFATASDAAAASVAVADLALAPGYAAAVAVRGETVTVGARHLLGP